MIIGYSGKIGSGKDTAGMITQALTMPDDSNRYLLNPIEYSEQFQGNPNLHGGWKIKKFAGKLKQIASLVLGIPVEDFEKIDVKNQSLGSKWSNIVLTHNSTPKGKTFSSIEEGMEYIFEKGLDISQYGVKENAMTVRDFLQRLGTNACRDTIHQDFWVNALFSDYKPLDNNSEYPNWIITDVRFPNEANAIKEKGGIVVRLMRNIGNEPDATSIHPSETALDDFPFDYVINNIGEKADLVDQIKTMFRVMNIRK